MDEHTSPFHTPNYDDVVHLEAHGQWPNGVVPRWAEELAERWECYPVHPKVLEAAMKFEINKLRDVVGICHSAMVRHDLGTKVGKNLYLMTDCSKTFSSEIEIAARALGLAAIRKCVRCGAELNVTEATDESGKTIQVPEYVICGKCTTPEEKGMYSGGKE